MYYSLLLFLFNSSIFMTKSDSVKKPIRNTYSTRLNSLSRSCSVTNTNTQNISYTKNIQNTNKPFIPIIPKFKETKNDIKSETPDTKNEHFINKSYGKATFYFRVGEDQVGCPNVQTFNDGNRYGPCQYNGNSGVLYNSDSKYWCAVTNAEAYCGKTVTVYYKDRSINLTVMDYCPQCNNNKIDMSLDALIELTGSKEAACAINMPLPEISWNFI